MSVGVHRRQRGSATRQQKAFSSSSRASKRERERERKVCVCVCVCERERERESEATISSRASKEKNQVPQGPVRSRIMARGGSTGSGRRREGAPCLCLCLPLSQSHSVIRPRAQGVVSRGPWGVWSVCGVYAVCTRCVCGVYAVCTRQEHSSTAAFASVLG